jgi:hypothetical protein
MLRIRGKENRLNLNKFLRSKIARTNKDDPSSSSTSQINPDDNNALNNNKKLEFKPALSTVSGLVDLDLNNNNTNESIKTYSAEDMRPIIVAEKATNVKLETAQKNSLVKKAVHEPSNRMHDLKSKSVGYDSLLEDDETASQMIFQLSTRLDNNEDDTQVVLKSSKFLSFFNNLLNAKEMRLTHDVFFDMDVAEMENSTNGSNGSNGNKLSRSERLERISSAEKSRANSVDLGVENDGKKY